MVGHHLSRAGQIARDQQVISASWDRCRNEFGLDQWRGRREIAIRRERVRDSIEMLGPLFSACRSQVQHIFQNIVGSGHAVILTDQSGTIIEFAVQSALEDLFRQSGLRRGADWSENREGTNGIGTAIRERKSLTVYRDQHFHSDHASLTCTGAPVFDVEGDVLALFDVSSIGRKDDPDILAHTRALLEMSARLISRRNFQDHFADHWIMRFHRDAERVGLLEEGLLALDHNGRIVGADEQAMAHLALKDRCRLVGEDIDALFDVEKGRLADRLAEEGRAPVHLPVSQDFRVADGGLHARLIEPKPGHTRSGLLGGRPIVPTDKARGRTAVRSGPSRLPAGRGVKEAQPATDARMRVGKQNTEHPFDTGVSDADALMRLVGHDATLYSLSGKARKLFDHDVPLLISGETGAGKESFALALHQSSSRADAPFIAVNCGALPENLIEGELFGYKAGAFTGAQSTGFKGQILAANGGTLLLDEIGDMPLSAQTRLLQVLERRQVTPLGSTVGVDLDIRLLAATHQPLEKLCAEGRFREDLYYRVCGFTVALPALRERSDLAYLIERLLPGRALENRADFSPDARRMIELYDWPGNIRQLKHVLKTADILSGDGPILPDHLQIGGSSACSGSFRFSSPSSVEGLGGVSSSDRRLDFANQEKARIEASLHQTKWNVSLCATQLGVSRNTLYRKMKKYNISRSD